MRILVLSDTHIPRRAGELPRTVTDALEGVDLIIHAGDFTSMDLYHELRAFGPLKAVHGNMDDPELCEILPEKLIFDLEGRRIGLMHGFGAPYRLGDRVIRKFSEERIDLVIFGHSHRAQIKEISGTTLLNPGSPTDHYFATRQSFAMIEIGDFGIKPEIIYL
jgi:putative phosphoesterase